MVAMSVAFVLTRFLKPNRYPLRSKNASQTAYIFLIMIYSENRFPLFRIML